MVLGQGLKSDESGVHVRSEEDLSVFHIRMLLTIMSSARETFLDAGRSIGMRHAALSKCGAARDNSTAGKIFSQSIVPDRDSAQIHIYSQ
jgi:hypothetical protein